MDDAEMDRLRRTIRRVSWLLVAAIVLAGLLAGATLAGALYSFLH